MFRRPRHGSGYRADSRLTAFTARVKREVTGQNAKRTTSAWTLDAKLASAQVHFWMSTS